MDAWLRMNKFDEDQPRDEDGKFTSGGGSSKPAGGKKPASMTGGQINERG